MVQAVIGNSVVLWVILYHKRMRTVTNYFLMNLAFADLSITIFNVCFQFQYNLYFNWWFGKDYCFFSNFMAVAPTCASVFTMVSMSLDRYMAIVYPLRPRLSRRKTIGAILCIWVLATLCALPHALASRTNTFFFYHPSNSPSHASSAHHYYQTTTCIGDNYPDGDASDSFLYGLYNHFLLGVTYLVPLVVLTITYTIMGRELWGAQSIGEMAQEESIRAKRKVVKMMIIIVSAFMICWLPYHLYFAVFMGTFARDLDPLTALYVYLNIYWLAMSSTVVNPMICCNMNSRFRIGFKYVFRWLPCIRMSDREYNESDLCRDPRKASVSGHYRLRNLSLARSRSPRRSGSGADVVSGYRPFANGANGANGEVSALLSGSSPLPPRNSPSSQNSPSRLSPSSVPHSRSSSLALPPVHAKPTATTHLV